MASDTGIAVCLILAFFCAIIAIDQLLTRPPVVSGPTEMEAAFRLGFASGRCFESSGNYTVQQACVATLLAEEATRTGVV